MLELILEKDEGTFRLRFDRGSTHLVIDCSCGSTAVSFEDPQYALSKSHDRYVPRNPEDKERHLFYLNEAIFLSGLKNHHSEENGQDPFLISCDSCGTDFPLTHEGYLEICTVLIDEYDKTHGNSQTFIEDGSLKFENGNITYIVKSTSES